MKNVCLTPASRWVQVVYKALRSVYRAKEEGRKRRLTARTQRVRQWMMRLRVFVYVCGRVGQTLAAKGRRQRDERKGPIESGGKIESVQRLPSVFTRDLFTRQYLWHTRLCGITTSSDISIHCAFYLELYVPLQPCTIVFFSNVPCERCFRTVQRVTLNRSSRNSPDFRGSYKHGELFSECVRDYGNRGDGLRVLLFRWGLLRSWRCTMLTHCIYTSLPPFLK